VSPHGKIGIVGMGDKEAGIKACKIVGKRMSGKKLQLAMHDGRNILTDNREYMTGDTLIVEIPSQKITEHLKLEPKMLVYLIAGKHAGTTGTVENVAQNKITYRTKKGQVFETLKSYAFVIGKGSPAITLPEGHE
jgi:small subunit ribosomal protein S4e